MPNTLAHIGIQALASRTLLPHADLRWVFAGCVAPDVPWIANRALATLWPGLDVFVMRPYWIAQASWLGSLWLCGALALLSAQPRRVFALLAGNAFAHLLLDALQTKWGNGVHLLAPFSWHTWNLGWFWPESAATWLLTALGAAAAVFALAEVWRRGARWRRPRSLDRAHAFGAALLLAIYLSYPLLVSDAVMAADAHSLETLRHPAERAGREAGFDRVWLEITTPGEGRLHVLGGEVLHATGALGQASGPVSARGRFVDARTIVLDEVHPHGTFPRALASYLGLAAVAAVVGVGWISERRAGAGQPPPS